MFNVEFYAMKIAVEMLEALRCKLHMFGALINEQRMFISKVKLGIRIYLYHNQY